MSGHVIAHHSYIEKKSKIKMQLNIWYSYQTIRHGVAHTCLLIVWSKHRVQFQREACMVLVCPL